MAANIDSVNAVDSVPTLHYPVEPPEHLTAHIWVLDGSKTSAIDCMNTYKKKSNSISYNYLLILKNVK